MSNSANLATTQEQKPSFRMVITSDKFQKMISNTLNDPERARRFTSSIISAVGANAQLQECKASTILAGALLGESLNLSPSPQLGQYYLVPFSQKARKDRQGNVIQPAETKAQFILGYKGYLQLAMRSGQLRKINVIEIKQGELIKFDPINEDISVSLIDDWDEREAAKTIGYYAFFELTNGFRKAIYWSKKQMLSHADMYSPAFSKDIYIKIQNGEIADKDMWKYSSFWYKSFDEMAKKTMLRQLISKGGCPMSIEMQQAYENDNQYKDIDSEGNIISDDVTNDIEVNANVTEHSINNVPQAVIDEPAPQDVQQVDLSSL